MFRRILRLFSGKLRKWVKRREARDPEAVFESAINDRIVHYRQLREAAGNVIYMRNKLNGDLQQKITSLAETNASIAQAIDEEDDPSAKLLLRLKHELMEDIEKLRNELTALTADVDTAKGNLIKFKDGISQLQSEKARFMARLLSAKGMEPLSLTYDEDVHALDEVRMSIGKMLAQGDIDRELSGEDTKLNTIRQRSIDSKISIELNELKQRRHALIPMERIKVAK